jgi:hypothetical protein
MEKFNLPESSEYKIRFDMVLRAMNNFNGMATDETADLTNQWMVLKGDLSPAIARECSNGYKHGNALVLQFSSASMSDKSDAEVIDNFFDAFGSMVRISDGRGNMIDVPVTVRNFRAILNSRASDIVVTDGSMILPTEFEGVSIKIDGSAVTDFDISPSRTIRPMLLFSTK